MTPAVLDRPAYFTADLTDPIWGTPPWPERFSTLRDHQLPAIASIVEHFRSGAEVVILDAPTGSGKTGVAEAVRRILAPERTLYCPDTIGLQTQFMESFPYAKLLKGRANYPTVDRPDLFNDSYSPLSAADCLMKKELLPACGNCVAETPIPVVHCRLCHPTSHCGYQQAKIAAQNSPLAVLNTSYLIAECNSPGSRFTGADLIVIDEADTLASTLLNQTEVFFSRKRIAELGLEPPRLKTVASSWVEWVAEEAIPQLKSLADAAGDEVRSKHQPDVEVLRRLSYLSRTLQKLYMLRNSLEMGNAVYDGYDEGTIKFQPVHVAPFGPNMIWQHGKKFLLMSATIIDAGQRVREWGIEAAGLRWELVKVPSTFPVERRPVHIKNAASMTYKEKDIAWPQMAEGVRKVLALPRLQGQRTLIHTVSYGFTESLEKALQEGGGTGRLMLSYGNAKERARVLEMFKKVPGCVLLAPSMERGVDLPMEDCRAVILCKMPFPSMKDKRVIARLYSPGGQQWMMTEVVAKIVQMTGRAMRSEDDFCETFILDSQFTTNIWPKAKNLFPTWWKAAMDWSGGGI